MSPFLKGVLGFFGCAAVTALVYHIGKNAGREETLREIEAEERDMTSVPVSAPAQTAQGSQNEPQENVENTAPVAVQQAQTTPVEKVRKMHGIKNKILGGGGIIRDLLHNPDNKKVLITVEEGDIVARISPK